MTSWAITRLTIQPSHWPYGMLAVTAAWTSPSYRLCMTGACASRSNGVTIRAVSAKKVTA